MQKGTKINTSIGKSSNSSTFILLTDEQIVTIKRNVLFQEKKKKDPNTNKRLLAFPRKTLYDSCTIYITMVEKHGN